MNSRCQVLNHESFVFGLLTRAEFESGFCAEVKTIAAYFGFWAGEISGLDTRGESKTNNEAGLASASGEQLLSSQALLSLY